VLKPTRMGNVRVIVLSKHVVNVGVSRWQRGILGDTVDLVERSEMQHVLGLCCGLNIVAGEDWILAQGAVLAKAELLIKGFVTLDKGPTVLGGVFLGQIPKQCLQDRRVPRGVRTYGILQSPEQSCIGLVMLSCGCRLLTMVAFIEGKLYVNGIVAFRPASPEFCVFTRILGRFSEKGDIRDVETQTGTETGFEVRPYIGDTGARLGKEFFPRHEQGQMENGVSNAQQVVRSRLRVEEAEEFTA
jgi:hypothetical protein